MSERREREGKREGGGWRERERESVCVCVCVSICITTSEPNLPSLPFMAVSPSYPIQLKSKLVL